MKWTKRQSGVRLSHDDWGIMSLISMSCLLIGCYDSLEPPPLCFESTERPPVDEERLMRTFRLGVSGYCSSDRITCQEIWTGFSEQELKANPYYYFKYPYISLIQEVPISEESPFSLCQIPDRCELPQCECFQTADCDEGEVCVGRGFVTGEKPEWLTACLPACAEGSGCTLSSEPSDCEQFCYSAPN